jgi:hypothetical protein
MDPIDEAALLIACKCVTIVRHCLGDYEAGEALREFIDTARRELEHYFGERGCRDGQASGGEPGRIFGNCLSALRAPRAPS